MIDGATTKPASANAAAVCYVPTIRSFHAKPNERKFARNDRQSFAPTKKPKSDPRTDHTPSDLGFRLRLSDGYHTHPGKVGPAVPPDVEEPHAGSLASLAVKQVQPRV